MYTAWLLLILPCITVMAADPQRTTSFGNSAGQLPQQQPVSTNGGNQSPMMGPSMGEAFNNPNNMGFYRNLELPPNVGPGQGAIFPPEVPNFYFNAGFNKGLGFRFPDALTGANYFGAGQHSPLGDLWATKADLLPVIFKTGFFVAAVLVILKIIIFLVTAKHNFLLAGPLGSGGSVVAPSPVPVVSVLSNERANSKSASDDNRIKRETSGSPVVSPETDFDQILAQLESIRAHFDQN